MRKHTKKEEEYEKKKKGTKIGKNAIKFGSITDTIDY